MDDTSSLNQDMAIRRFCAARAEQEQKGDSMEEAVLNEIDDLWSPSDTTSSTTPPLGSAEEQFANSFFNMDDCNNNNNKEEEDDLLNTLLAMVNDIERYASSTPAMIQGDNFNDFAMVSDVLPLPPSVMSSSTVRVEEGHQVRDDAPVDQGLHLVHLLLACAEAVGCRDTRLATQMLNQVWEQRTQCNLVEGILQLIRILRSSVSIIY